jgi:hypothetical protein
MARLDDLGEPSRGRGRERCTEQLAGWNQLVVALVGGALLEQFDDLLSHIHRATLPRAPLVITSAAQRVMAGRMGAYTCEVAASRLAGVAARDDCRVHRGCSRGSSPSGLTLAHGHTTLALAA